jgi:sugar phosphate permease
VLQRLERQKETRTKGAAAACSRTIGAAAWHELLDPTILSLLAASVFSLLTLKTMSDWSGLYLVEGWGVTPLMAAELTMFSELGGIAGSCLSGPVCDMLLRGDAVLYSALTSAFCGVACLGLLLPNSPPSLAATTESMSLSTAMILRFSLFFAGIFVNGPKTLLPLAMAKAAPVGRAGAYAGLLGLAGQVGSALSGTGIALLLEILGWVSFAWIIAGCAWLLAVVLVLPRLFHSSLPPKVKIQ